MFFNKKRKIKDTMNKKLDKNFKFSFLDTDNTIYEKNKAIKKDIEAKKSIETKISKKIVKTEKKIEIVQDDNEDIKVRSRKKIKSPYIVKLMFAIAVVIGIYILWSFLRNINNNNILVYEVIEGEIVNVDRHKGVIYRDEEEIAVKNDGYINFFVANKSKVSKGSFLYTINDNISEYQQYPLNDEDKSYVEMTLRKLSNSITDEDFSNVYLAKQTLDNIIEEQNLIKQFEGVDVENEITAKEKGYAKYAGIICFNIDGFSENKIEDFNENILRDYDNVVFINDKKKVKKDEKVYKIVKDSEYNVVFDSSFDYDNYAKGNVVNVKFDYDNINTYGRVTSFWGSDNKKHFKLTINQYPEHFLDKRVVEFEIENKQVRGYKIPIKAITTKNCYKIPKSMMEIDMDTNENFLYKVGTYGTKEKVSCNISKEDKDFYYISMDDVLSLFRYGDVLVNRYGDNYSLSEVVNLYGVYNMNKGYAVFKNVDIIDKTNEFAIIDQNTSNGIAIYDHIALNATELVEGDLIS